jgi:hypothetical protein
MPNNPFQHYSLHTTLFIVILVEAVAARFYGIDRLGLWSDEIWAVSESSQRSLAGMIEYVRNYESHPPGHYFLLRITQYVFGNSAFAVRLPSALFGVASVVMVYHLGCKYFSIVAGLISAAILAGNYPSIYFSQEARANIIVAFFILLSLHTLFQIVSGKDRTKGKYIYYWVAATLACYLHYAGLAMVLCQVAVTFVMLLLKKEGTGLQAARLAMKLFLPVLLFQLPWLPGLYHQLAQGPQEAWQTVPDTHTLWATLLFLVGDDRERLLAYLALFGVFFCYLVWIVSYRMIHSGTAKFDAANKDQIIFILYLMALMILPVLLFFIKSNISQPVYNSRHFLYLAPMLALYIGRIVSLPVLFSPLRVQPFLLVALIGTIIIYQNQSNIKSGLYSKSVYKEDYRGGVEVIVEDKLFRRAANTAIISTSPFFNHYLKRFLHGQASDMLYTTADQAASVKAYLDEQGIEQFYYLGGADQIVTKVDDIAGNERLIALAKHYQPVCRSKLHRVHVIKFRGPAKGDIDYSTLPLCPYE